MSLPFDLRWRAAFDDELARAIASIATQAIEERYRKLAGEAGLREPRGGSVVVMQRFGSDLRTNLHLHGIVLDGAYGEDEHSVRRFARASAPSPAEVEAVLARIVESVRAWLDGREHDDALDDEQLALAQNHAASSQSGAVAAPTPENAPNEQGRLVLLPTRRKARIDGFDLDAEVAVHEHERERLEYLCRYILRPPIALDRVKLLAEQLVCIELKRPWRDGTSHVSMSPSVFPHEALVRPGCPVVPPVQGPAPTGCRPLRSRRDRAPALAPSRTSRRCASASARCRPFGPLRCWSDALPMHPARGPPEHEETLDFP